MLENKLAISNHLIIIFLISIIVSLFLFFILDGIYGKAHEDCAKIKYEITKVCRNNNLVGFTIKNSGPKAVKFSFNKKVEDKNVVLAGEKNTLNYISIEDSVSVIPFIRDTGKVYFCSGKRQSKNIRIISQKC